MAKLMTHLYYGDPSEAFSMALVYTLLESGADILEIGIPFPNPTYDGEVLRRACKRAIRAGVTPQKVLAAVQQLRKQGVTKPIYLTSYYHSVVATGRDTFLQQAKKSGAQGFIIPDLPEGEQRKTRSDCREIGLTLIQLVHTSYSRIALQQALRTTKDFVYCVGAQGITGVRDTINPKTITLIRKVKRLSDVHAFVGFGISTPEHVRTFVRQGTDGVIVGSAIANIYQDHLDNPLKALPRIGAFIKSLKEATIQEGI